MGPNKIFGFIMLVMMTFTVLFGCCSAKVYKVGDSDGWTWKEDMFHSWAKGKEFHVGDTLVFNYDHNVNDVTQVSSALQYQFCDNSSPKAVYNTGEDVVILTEPGHHYFITSNHAQCTYGQKLDVLVVHDTSRPVPPPPPSKSRPTPPPPPSKSRPTPPPPPSKSRPTPPPPQPTPPPSKSRPTPPPPQPTPPPSKILPFGKVYKVGDVKGWSVYNSYFYYRWSEAKQFYVGDNLFFQYNKDLNNVIEISDDLEFKSCEPNSTVAVYNTGHDLIKLTKPGVHYFISLKTGLCQAGLKLRVTVRPLPGGVSSPNVPTRRIRLSPLERFNNWLRSFRPPHHP